MLLYASVLYGLGLSKRLGVGCFYACIIEALYASFFRLEMPVSMAV
jgi:hypothetical protein